jgi:alkylated DNA repair dioxygenase AlkB
MPSEYASLRAAPVSSLGSCYSALLGFISLGAPATMRFRRRKPGGFDRASAELSPRSIYHLSGEARHQWEHSIAEMAVTRWSITFRSLSEKGRRHSGKT